MTKHYNYEDGKNYSITDGVIRPAHKAIEIRGLVITEIADAPKVQRENAKQAGVTSYNNPLDLVFFGGYLVRRELAVEAISQYRQILAEESEALNRAVPGLEILRAARADNERYATEFEAMMDDEYNDGARPPATPLDVQESAGKYPIAAAYLKAESWEYASHYVKSSCGKQAKAAIAAGVDYKVALAKMETDWSDYHFIV